MAPPAAVASWLKYVRLLNLLTALVQLLAGVGSLAQIFSLDVPATFIAVYVMLFALLLLAYECRLAAFDAFLRTNFGFLFSLRGLGAYLLFIGLLDFGMAGGVFGSIAGASACFTAFVVLSTSFCTRGAEAGSAAFNTSNDRLPTYGSSSFAATPGMDKPTPPPLVAVPVAAAAPATPPQSVVSPSQVTTSNHKKSNNKKGTVL